MLDAIIITPVKNSITSTMETIIAIEQCNSNIHHIIFNDFSDPETKEILENNQSKYNFELIHLEDITHNPSPNYKLVLQNAQSRALEENVPLIIVESDVKVKADTFDKMLSFQKNHLQVGLVGAITTDESGTINFPYLKFKNDDRQTIETKRSLSFCCTLLSLDFLQSYSFLDLDQSKDWYDTFISSKAIELNFKNYVLLDVPVLHQPHGSRPWKQLKYTNPIKYYFLKFTKGRDKI